MSLQIDKTSGGSNTITTEVVTVSRSDIYYGRKNPKTTIYQVTAGEASATMTVTEEAIGFFNTITEDISVSNDSTSYIISGYSNAQSMIFNILDTMSSKITKFLVNNEEIEFSESAINNSPTINYYSIEIPNDIGASDRYYYEAHVSCDVNTTITSRNTYWEIEYNADELDSEGHEVFVTQSAGNAYIYWSLTSGQEDTSAEATIPMHGGQVSTYVMSNTSWTITEE